MSFLKSAGWLWVLGIVLLGCAGNWKQLTITPVVLSEEGLEEDLQRFMLTNERGMILPEKVDIYPTYAHTTATREGTTFKTIIVFEEVIRMDLYQKGEWYSLDLMDKRHDTIYAFMSRDIDKVERFANIIATMKAKRRKAPKDAGTPQSP